MDASVENIEYGFVNMETFFELKSAFVSLIIRFTKKKPCSILNEIDILAITHYDEVDI